MIFETQAQPLLGGTGLVAVCLFLISAQPRTVTTHRKGKKRQSKQHHLLASFSTSSLISSFSYWWSCMSESNNMDDMLSSTRQHTVKSSECSPQITKSGERGFVRGSAISSTGLIQRSGFLPHPESTIDQAVPLLAHSSTGTDTCSYKGLPKYVDD
mmetsp:Transcript_41626/g.97146  ORF Transcript_41626/g.97146 Transcript_41626/m.97146 type:complete len:156 (+) Transcript_41626:635-1102(+)